MEGWGKIIRILVLMTTGAAVSLGCGSLEGAQGGDEPGTAPETADIPWPDYSECVSTLSWDPTKSYQTLWTTECEGGACADGEDSARILSLVQEELNRVGVGHAYRFIRANEVDADYVELVHVLSLDWFQSSHAIRIFRDLDEGQVAATVAENYCLELPQSLAPFRTVMDTMLACDPEMALNLCFNAFAVTQGCTPIVSGAREARVTESNGDCTTSDRASITVRATSGTASGPCRLSDWSCP